MTARQLSETLRAMSVWAGCSTSAGAVEIARRLSKVDPFILPDKCEGYQAGEAFCWFCRYQEPHHGSDCPLHGLAPEPDALELEKEVIS